jgi:cholinesterase
MQLHRFVLFAASVAIVPVAMTSIAGASSYSAVVVYGDSLSDNGNVYAVDGHTVPLPPPYYYDGRFSNGPVAVEQLAAQLGIPLEDFAFGGATTGIGNYGDGGTQTTVVALPGMQEELGLSAPFLSSPLVPSALFIVWGGANDFIVNGSPAVAAADIVNIVNVLLADGAQHILVPGVPDIGLTPDYYGDSAATTYSETFNADLQAILPAGATYFDTFNLLDEIEADPSKYGITDLTDPCFNAMTLSICGDPSQHLFWDGFHPTTTVDTIVAEQFDGVVAAPEPSSILMMGTGIGGLMVLLRRRAVTPGAQRGS